MRKLLLFLALLLSTTAFAASNSDKVSPDLKRKNADELVNVIIQYRHAPHDQHKQKIAAQGGRASLVLPVVNGIVARITAGALHSLERDPEVIYISADRPVKAHLNYVAAAVNASYGWTSGLDGSGISVAVIDSGIGNVEDLKNSAGAFRVVYSQDFVGGGTDDQYGHGTHVAGIIGGTGRLSTCSNCTMTFRGMATNVSFVNLHALDNNGQGTDSSVINAINAAISLKSKYNIRVINLSLGRPVYESYTLDPLCQAVEQAYKAGIVVVVAAGNDGRDNSAGTQGYGTITVPGNDPYVITVGAMKTMDTLTRTDDVIASYSSKGPTSLDHVVKPDLVAPGNRVVSLIAPAGNLNKIYPSTLIPLTYYEATSNTALSNNYYKLSGTSMAAGVVSGAAVLLLQKNPALTPDQVKARLMKTAYKNLQQFSSTTDPSTGIVYQDQADVFTVGAGYLDIQAALTDSSVATLPASSPVAYFDSKTGNVYFVSDKHALWGSSTSWALNAVWGNNAFNATQVSVSGSNALWGNHALWGSSGTTAFNALWGTHALWGSSSQNLSEVTTVLINGED